MRALTLLALAACAPDDTDTVDPLDPDAIGESLTFEVVRDCPAEPGVICPFAGSGNNGFNGDGRDKLESWFSLPMSVEFSPYGDPIIADWNNHKLRRINPDGTLETIMGTSFLGDGDFDQRDMSEGAPGTDVNLNHPTEQRYFSSGILLSASWHTHKLRTWDPFTGITRVMMGGAYGFLPEEAEPGIEQSAVGALLNQPRWLEIDSDGNVIVVDMRNERIRYIDMTRFTIRTIAGSGHYGVAGTTTPEADCTSEEALSACFAFPQNMNPEPGGAIALSPDEAVIYIADSEAHVVRAFDRTTGRITVLAGSPGVRGDVDGAVGSSLLSYPAALALDPATDELFVADTDNHKVKVIDLQGGQIRTFAGTGEPTCPGEILSEVRRCAEQATAGDGGDALDATLYRPFGVELDLDGDLVIADTYNHRFRVVVR